VISDIESTKIIKNPEAEIYRSSGYEPLGFTELVDISHLVKIPHIEPYHAAEKLTSLYGPNVNQVLSSLPRLTSRSIYMLPNDVNIMLRCLNIKPIILKENIGGTLRDSHPTPNGYRNLQMITGGTFPIPVIPSSNTVNLARGSTNIYPISQQSLFKS
jgi:hypothetical protein